MFLLFYYEHVLFFYFLYGFRIIIVERNSFDLISFGQYSSFHLNLIAYSNLKNHSVHNKSHGIHFSAKKLIFGFVNSLLS
jgi:hypothetical protein